MDAREFTNGMHLIPLDQDKEPTCGRGFLDEANYEQNTQKVIPGEMYGVLTGRPNRVLVIDWDCYGGKCEFELTEEMLTRKVGGEGAYIVKTRSGGYHTYFAWDEERFGDWKGTVGIEGFVDIRTTGNYVVGAHAPGYELLRGDINNLPPMPNDLYSFLDGKVGHKVERADTECSFTQASVTPLLEDMGFTGIHWLSGATSYDFECDQCRPQRGTTVGQCPCCGGFHEGNGKGGGNHFYVAEVGLGVLTVKNHGNCKPRQFRYEVGCLVTGITEKEQNEIKEGTSAGYIEVRREFEKHVAKILTKDLFCDDSCYGTTGDITKFSEAALVRRYRELSFVDENGILRKGKKNGFIEKWLDDDNKRVYDNLDVVPKNCSNKTYNLWRGYPVEGIPSELGKEGDVKPFLELLLVLCGGSENALEYALNWFACLFQRPEEKPITSLVFRGVQGTGKGTFLHLLHALMGKTFHETADPKKDIFGTHANMIEGKKCLALNEADECIMKMYRKLLKSMLTDTSFTINPKHVQLYVIMNLVGFLFFSNDDYPVFLEMSDRRFVVMEPLLTHLNDQTGFLKEFRDAYIKDPRNLRAIYDHLMGLDLSTFDYVKDRPTTDAYSEMKRGCMPKFTRWFEHCVTVEFPEKWVGNKIRNSDIFIEYQAWLPAAARGQDSATKVGNKLKDFFKKEKGHRIPMEEDHLRQGRDENGVYWEIDRDGCFEWLKNNGYTGETELAPAVVWCSY